MYDTLSKFSIHFCCVPIDFFLVRTKENNYVMITIIKMILITQEQECNATEKSEETHRIEIYFNLSGQCETAWEQPAPHTTTASDKSYL